MKKEFTKNEVIAWIVFLIVYTLSMYFAGYRTEL